MMQTSLAVVVCSCAMLLTLSLPATAAPLTGAQRAALRTSRNAVIEVESQITRMEYYLAEWKGLGSQVGDKRVNDFNTASNAALAAYNKAVAELEKLPADDEEANKLREKINELAPKFNEYNAAAKAQLEGAQAAVEAAGGQEAIGKDVERISDIASQFGPFEALIPGNAKEAAELLKDWRPAVKEVQDFEAKYADFLKQNNADTAGIANSLDTAKRRLAEVPTDAQAALPQILEAAKGDLKFARELMQQGLQERKPMFFAEDGGVRSQLDNGKNRIWLAHLIDPEQAAPLVAEAKQLEAEVVESGQKLETEIIAANKGPKDLYRGDDADTLKEQAKEAWLAEHADDEIVEVRIPSDEWDRESKWTYWRDGFYWSDASSVQASIILKAKGRDGSEELHYWPVNITKDHTKNDSVSFSPWVKEPLEKMPVQFRMLPENL